MRARTHDRRTPPGCRLGAARPARGARPRGIALLMSLAVVMLLTFFMSEYFFATGLELRGMTTFKEAQQARVLARSVFKAVQLGLRQDEVDFFDGYRQAEALLLGGVSIPWEDGLLLQLEIAPQDHLFNVNQNHNQQSGQAQDIARRQVFLQLFLDEQVPVPLAPEVTEPVSEDTILAIYASLYDWVDGDDDEYLELASVRGAEASAYRDGDEDLRPKNGQLDRLEEMRLVRGVVDSKIPWAVWEQRLTALPKAPQGKFDLPEMININIASHAEIVRFLESRRVDPEEVGGAHKVIHEALNVLADNAEEIAGLFAPTEGERESFVPDQIVSTLSEGGYTEQSSYAKNFAFSTVNRYYRVRIVVEVAAVRARLEGMLDLKRDPVTRIATNASVLWVTVN